jgi:hypothetical protein
MLQDSQTPLGIFQNVRLLLPQNNCIQWLLELRDQFSPHPKARLLRPDQCRDDTYAYGRATTVSAAKTSRNLREVDCGRTH